MILLVSCTIAVAAVISAATLVALLNIKYYDDSGLDN